MARREGPGLESRAEDNEDNADKISSVISYSVFIVFIVFIFFRERGTEKGRRSRC